MARIIELTSQGETVIFDNPDRALVYNAIMILKQNLGHTRKEVRGYAMEDKTDVR